jgi:hypothetical protein
LAFRLGRRLRVGDGMGGMNRMQRCRIQVGEQSKHRVRSLLKARGQNSVQSHLKLKKLKWRMTLTVSVSIVGSASGGSMASDPIADDSPETHVDYPDYEGDESRERGRERHEDRSDTAEPCAAETE